MKDVRAVLFDWDGTLLDSFPAGFRATVTVLRALGIELDRERFLRTYSPNWYESYRMLGVPEEAWGRADAMWRETYREQTSDLFPFVTETLSRLTEHGMTLGLVTSGDRERVRAELDRFELTGLFGAIVCFEDTDEKKPDPAPLGRALELLDVTASAAVYVGDRPEDVLMGRRVGTYTIAVESEYGPRSILEEASPDLILPHAGYLPDRF